MARQRDYAKTVAPAITQVAKKTPEQSAAPSAEGVVGPVIPTREEQSLAARLKEVRQGVAPRLHEASDRLNAGIFDAQQALAELRLGVAASIRFDESDPDPEGRILEWLSFRKHDGAWCFVLETWDDCAGERMDTTPLVKASRTERLEAVRRLPELLEKLIERSHDEIVQVEKGIESLASVVKEIREARS